jgi:hypothetical protein
MLNGVLGLFSKLSFIFFVAFFSNKFLTEINPEDELPVGVARVLTSFLKDKLYEVKVCLT